MALRRFSSSCCRSILHEYISPRATSCPLQQSGWIGSRLGAKRHLLSEDVVKLEDFQRRKLAVAHLATGAHGNFIEQFGHKLQKNSLVLRDELKLLLHLCQSAEDVKTARDAIYRYHAENRNVAHGEFRFGPLFMRLCYELGLEKMAVDTITDKEMRGFFCEPTSFNIAMDMLFVKGCHEDALAVLRSMRSQGVAFNNDTLTLAAAVCYKLNSTESHAICTSLMEEAQAKGHFVSRHTYCFAVALALKQNDTEKARLLFSQILSTDSLLCQNLKILVLAMSGATAEAVAALSSAVKPSKISSLVRKPEFSQEVVSGVSSSRIGRPASGAARPVPSRFVLRISPVPSAQLDQLRLRTEGEAQAAEAERAVWRLELGGQVIGQTLDDMLCRTPAPKRNMAPIVEDRRTSRRTLKALHSALLSE